MADEWIKLRKKLWRDGRLLILSRKCHASVTTCVGALCALWCLADDFACADGTIVGYTADDLNALVGVPNFIQSLPADWYSEKDGTPQLPEYQRHNGTTAKDRAKAAERQKKSRSCHKSVTGLSQKNVTRGEERRGDKRRERRPLFSDEEIAAQEAIEAAEALRKGAPK